MEVGRLEHRPDLLRRRLELTVEPPHDGRPAGGRVNEAEDHAQRGRLPRAVWPQVGNRALANLEAQVVDGDCLPEPLREVLDLDQVRGVT